MAPLAIGFVLDILLGDPRWLPHPVAGIGRGVELLESRLRRFLPRTPRGEFLGGSLLVLAVCSLSFAAPWLALRAAGELHPLAAIGLESLLGWQALALKGLGDAGGEVCRRLREGDLAAARSAVAHIVGRDTAGLDAAGVARAAVETVAENASDGVAAPLLYFSLGGAPLAFLYKAVNTMDSMIGHRDEKYLHFGRPAARLDDLANFFPARLTALLMLPAAALAGLDWRNAGRVLRRDRKNHSSPNSGHPEAAAAGALNLRLGGPASYGGRRVERPYLGDAARDIRPGDIELANRLLYATAFLLLPLGCAVRVFLGDAGAWN
jgi:adenosylcobinamide-phosphate synthase